MITQVVDLGLLKGNIERIKQNVAAKIFAVVKADAYGHGAKLCTYIQPEVYGFAVSCAAEAEELLNLGIVKPILILCPCSAADARRLKEVDNLIYTVKDLDDLRRHSRERIAIKLNTGMNRLGADEKTFRLIVEGLEKCKPKSVQLYTHFYSIEGAEKQFSCFEKYLLQFGGGFSHCCASSAIILPKKMHLSAIRCGLAIYGYGYEGLSPIMKAYSTIEQINFVKRGEHISYGDFTAREDMRIAIIRAGYADGIRRIEDSYVFINGKKCEIIGKICMDLCLAKVSTDVYCGDLAYFVDENIGADLLAKTQNTIVYEVLTAFRGNRINRIYK